MANAAVWRKMALNRQPVGCGNREEYEGRTWLMVAGLLHSLSDPTDRVFPLCSRWRSGTGRVPSLVDGIENRGGRFLGLAALIVL